MHLRELSNASTPQRGNCFEPLAVLSLRLLKLLCVDVVHCTRRRETTVVRFTYSIWENYLLAIHSADVTAISLLLFISRAVLWVFLEVGL